jgi:uncharacterized protein (TIGR00251 family)
MAGGTRLRLRVKPGAKRNAVLGVHDGALKVSIIAAPERGKANRAVLKLLGKVLEVGAEEIRLLAGESSQDKTVWVGLKAATVRERLEAE